MTTRTIIYPWSWVPRRQWSHVSRCATQDENRDYFWSTARNTRNLDATTGWIAPPAHAPEVYDVLFQPIHSLPTKISVCITCEAIEEKNPEKRIVFVMGPTNPLVLDSLHHDDPGNIRYGISISLSKLGYFNASHCIVTCLKFKEQLSWMRPIVNLLLIIWSTVQQGN